MERVGSCLLRLLESSFITLPGTEEGCAVAFVETAAPAVLISPASLAVRALLNMMNGQQWRLWRHSTANLMDSVGSGECVGERIHSVFNTSGF